MEHLLKNPIDQLFQVAYNKELNIYNVIGYTPQKSRKHFSSIEDPIEMLCKLIDDYLLSGYSLIDTGIFIENNIIPWFKNQISM